MAISSGAEEMARRYAGALLDLCVEKNALEKVKGELQAIKVMLEENRHFDSVFSSPVLASKDQQSFIEGLGEKMSLSTLTLNFLRILCENRRLGQLKAVILLWEQLISKRNKETIVFVESAKKLSDTQKKSLQSKIKEKLSGKIFLKERVNPDLIGGLKITVGSKMVDFSVKTQLLKLSQAMEGK